MKFIEAMQIAAKELGMSQQEIEQRLMQADVGTEGRARKVAKVADVALGQERACIDGLKDLFKQLNSMTDEEQRALVSYWRGGPRN